jgi:hypothetical protein
LTGDEVVFWEKAEKRLFGIEQLDISWRKKNSGTQDADSNRDEAKARHDSGSISCGITKSLHNQAPLLKMFTKLTKKVRGERKSNCRLHDHLVLISTISKNYLKVFNFSSWSDLKWL